jgi:regulator of telomere elongation helicase 1
MFPFLRTVVIVGIPFPPLFDPRIVLKRAWLGERRRVSTTKSNKNGIESGLLSPEEWYRIEGFRAVNQALGRIIRHRDDFGAVLLADSRFASAPSHTLPSWIRGVVSRYNQPEQLFPVMQRFFAEHGLLVERSRQRMATEATSCCNFH